MATEEEWQKGRVDMRCLDCGAMSAGSSWCFRCSSTNLEIRTHAETPLGDIMWCSGRPKQAGPAHLDGLAAAQTPQEGQDTWTT